MVHQRQAENGVAHLRDRGIGQEALGVLLEDGEHGADEGGERPDPDEHMGQVDAVKRLVSHMGQQQPEAEETRLQENARDHRRDVGLGFGMGAGQPDVEAD